MGQITWKANPFSVMKFPELYQSRSSQQPVTCGYHEPDQSCPRPSIVFVEDLLVLIYDQVSQMVFFLQVSPPKNLYVLLPSSTRATCPAHFIFLYFGTRVTLGNENRSWSSSICSLLQSPVTSSLSDPHNFLQHLQSMFLRQCKRPGFTRI
jgi:hypothetical protein